MEGVGDPRQHPLPEVPEPATLRAEEEREIHDSIRAQEIGMLSAGVGLVASYLGMLTLGLLPPHPMLMGILCCGPVAIPIGVITGSLSHSIFYRTRIPVPLLAVVFSLIADLTLMGWFLLGILSLH